MVKSADRAQRTRKKNLLSAIVVCGAVVGAFLFVIAILPQLVTPIDQGPKPIVHNHAYLKIEVDGKEMTVPANIGIDTELFKSHELDGYGLPDGFAPLHTHDTSGTIHVEASRDGNFTLGNFLDIWGYQVPDNSNVTLKTGNVFGLTINTVPDYRNHILADHEYMKLEVITSRK